MTKEINSDQVNQAAHEYLVEVSNIHMNPVTVTYITRAFVAGSDWQLTKSSATIRHWREQVGKLESEIGRMKDERSQSVPLTEIMAAIMGAKDQLQDAQFELRHMIVDVGQKVEAVLDQVMPQEVNGEACDTAESEADHWRRRATEMQVELEALKLQRDDWHCEYGKLVSDIVHGRKPDVDPSGCRALPDAASYEEACRAAVASEPITDESGSETMPPPWAGDIVDVITFGGRLLVCCQNGVFSLDGPYLRPLKFV